MFVKPAIVPSARSWTTSPAASAVIEHERVVLAVELVLERLPDSLAQDGAGARVVGAHERDLARPLVDVDRDDRHLGPFGADLLGRVLEELEVDAGRRLPGP